MELDVTTKVFAIPGSGTGDARADAICRGTADLAGFRATRQAGKTMRGDKVERRLIAPKTAKREGA